MNRPDLAAILLIVAIGLMLIIVSEGAKPEGVSAGDKVYRADPDEGYQWTMEICDVRLVFHTREAMQHFRARLVAYPELGEEISWLFDLIDAEEVEKIGPERMNEFLIEVMSGAERKWQRQYEKH